MTELFELIKKIAAAPTVSGNETAALPVIKEVLKPYTDNIFCDSFGNIKAVFGKGEIFLEAHIDKIGMIVTAVEDGFIKAAPIGGVDSRVLPAGKLSVLGGETLYGVAASIPPHLASAEDSDIAKEVTDILIDVGLPAGDTEKKVSLGDRIMYNEDSVMLGDDKICSAYLDNSVGAAVIIKTAELLHEKNMLDNITLCFTAQEEAGLRGASSAVFGCGCSCVLSVDTSFAAAPNIRPEKCGRLGGGPMIGFSPILDREMSLALETLADELQVPCSREVMGAVTGTNADIISKSCEGFRTALISVPIRNMHTPSEICDITDVENTAYLIAEYIMRGANL